MATEFYNRNWRMPRSSNSNKISNYSMSFDGTDEYVEISDSTLLNGKTAVTISMWINPSLQGIYDAPLNYYSFANGGNNKIGFAYPASTGNYLRFTLQTSSVQAYVNSSTNSIPLNQWTHIVGVGEAGQALKIYINGVEDSATQSSTMPTLYQDANLFIGKDNGAAGRNFNGKIDHVSIFDYALTDGTGGTVNQIAQLYGNSTDGVGNPMALSTKPVAYYKIGDKATFNGSEYLVTNAASEVYSPYALDFDAATRDNIETGGPIFTTAFSFSAWFKTTNTSDQAIWGVALDATASSFLRIAGTNYRVKLFDASGGNAKIDATTSVPTDGNWHHACFTADGTTNANGVKLYLDGVKVGEVTMPNAGFATNNKNFIGISDGTNKPFDGSISNASLWNAVLTQAQITEIYNSGKPANLNNHSAYSNLSSWWQLGENSSFDGTNWTVLDEKGTNNGTSANMGEDAIVNGVGTTGNGLSSGMGGADNITGDAAYSTGNAVSYGMGVDAKSTSVPS